MWEYLFGMGMRYIAGARATVDGRCLEARSRTYIFMGHMMHKRARCAARRTVVPPNCPSLYTFVRSSLNNTPALRRSSWGRADYFRLPFLLCTRRQLSLMLCVAWLSMSHALHIWTYERVMLILESSAFYLQKARNLGQNILIIKSSWFWVYFGD